MSSKKPAWRQSAQGSGCQKRKSHCLQPGFWGLRPPYAETLCPRISVAVFAGAHPPTVFFQQAEPFAASLPTYMPPGPQSKPPPKLVVRLLKKWRCRRQCLLPGFRGGAPKPYAAAFSLRTNAAVCTDAISRRGFSTVISEGRSPPISPMAF